MILHIKACTKHGKEDEYIKNFCGKAKRKRKDLRLGANLTLKWAFRKLDMVIRTGFI
jgi:hypothetical protein